MLKFPGEKIAAPGGDANTNKLAFQGRKFISRQYFFKNKYLPT
jgi:hypothetical protein